jgi:glucan phosphoethanolaminetransferase (alkaline phosphatase superfamily)
LVAFIWASLVAILCWFAAFFAGETQIWPGDLRVAAVLPGFCLFVFSMYLPRFMKPGIS